MPEYMTTLLVSNRCQGYTVDKRIEYPDAFYHITERGNERKNIFKSNRDRERFLGYLESANERYKAIIHTYWRGRSKSEAGGG